MVRLTCTIFIQLPSLSCWPHASLAVLCRAAQNETVQKTLVAEDSKKRQKARLSWYHPDDTVSSVILPQVCKNKNAAGFPNHSIVHEVQL